MLKRIASNGVFWSQVVFRTQEMGAVAPSSRFLAKKMVEGLGEIPHGACIIELGPGSGSFTRYIHKKRPDLRIVAVEKNPVLADLLGRHLPHVDVISGCATALNTHLQRLGLTRDDVAGVMCGLPLVCFPPPVRRDILQSVADVLDPGQRLVAFTYFDKMWKFPMPKNLKMVSSARVLLNIPPSCALSFEKAGVNLAQ